MIGLYNTIRVSKVVFDLVDGMLRDDDADKLSCWLETFNNCREQGFVLMATDSYKQDKEKYTPSIYIWAHEGRNSDEIYIRWQNEYPNNGMYNEETYKLRSRTFRYDEYYKAAEYVYELLKDRFDL